MLGNFKGILTTFFIFHMNRSHHPIKSYHSQTFLSCFQVAQIRPRTYAGSTHRNPQFTSQTTSRTAFVWFSNYLLKSKPVLEELIVTTVLGQQVCFLTNNWKAKQMQYRK
jgi:hypothetical protein